MSMTIEELNEKLEAATTLIFSKLKEIEQKIEEIEEIIGVDEYDSDSETTN